MSKKMDFIERAIEPGTKLAPLCREFGVSRQTGYKWIKRFKEHGFEGLVERSRRPSMSPLAFGEELVAAVLEARDRYSDWGPKKIYGLLHRRFGERTPSLSTLARMLRRFGRVRERRLHSPLSFVEAAPVTVVDKPNDLWTVDFKGWWRVHDGSKCEPLTIRDAFSRFIFTTLLSRPSFVEVKAAMEKVFRKYGLPAAIQCDNGPPFISVRSRGGLSRLSAWWLDLGIRVVRGRLGCPQDNGGHERMHRDIAMEVERAPARTLRIQQRVLDRWRHEFNHVRPHEALDGKTPAEIHRPSERRSLEVVPPTYPTHYVVKTIAKNGVLSFEGDKYCLSTALGGKDIGLEQLDELHWKVWFRDVDCGELEVVPSWLDHVVPRSPSSHTQRPARHDAHEQPGSSAPQAPRRAKRKRQTSVNGVLTKVSAMS